MNVMSKERLNRVRSSLALAGVGLSAAAASTASHAEIDVSGVTDSIDGAIPAVTSIGTAVLGVLVVVAVFKWVRRAF